MPPTKILSLFLCFCLIFEQSLFAQTIDLSRYFARNPGQIIPQSDKFRPLHLRYISYDNQANDFKILLDKGDFFNQKTKKPKNEKTLELEQTTQELMKYFFVGLALPNEKFWVNLRPDSPDNILDPDLEKTDIGRIFLEADLQLKKDTAGMTSPQTKEGREYWDKLYKKAGELFPAAGGSENITIPTITRPWIVPNEIIIREAPDNAYIYKATLKVMLEEDYLRGMKDDPSTSLGARGRGTRRNYSFSDPRLKELNEYSTQLIKETIIPKLTYAVNTSKRYAPLRQVYYSLILAQWFKQKYGSPRSIRATGISVPVNNYIDLIDSGNLANLTSSQPYDKQRYFQQYQKSFKDGEYNLQEPVYTPMGQSVRRYMSGGVMLDSKMGMIDSPVYIIPAERKLTFVSSALVPAELESSLNISQGVVKIEKTASSSVTSFFKNNTNQKWLPPAKDSKEIKKRKNATRYSDPFQDFSGISLEHFVAAIKRIKIGLPENEFKKLWSNYQAIDEVNGQTYENPRLRINVEDQNDNPGQQAINEAVANCLDALGHNIGKFGKGVKQILDWLYSTGADRVDVFTREKDVQPYQLTILKDTLGQEYIQIKEITEKAFRSAGAINSGQGTIVKVTIQDAIPLKDEQLNERHRNSQESIIAGLHKRFYPVTSVRIVTQIGNQEPEEVNGFETRKIVVPSRVFKRPVTHGKGKNVKVRIDGHTITIIDDGKGMNAETLSRMFVPGQTMKYSHPLSAEGARKELENVEVIQDKALARRVSFSRNEEVIVAVDMPQDIIGEALVDGGLILEFGSLLDVFESRDQIMIPLNLKAGEVSNFQLAVEYILNQLMDHPELSTVEKLKYINTVIIGLEGLVKQNENYEYAVNNIRGNLRRQLIGIIESAKKEGFAVLSHNAQFQKIAIPQDKKVLYLNRAIFNWQGVVSLKEVGAILIPGITLGGEKKLSLVAVPFNADSLKVTEYRREWHSWREDERNPLIATDSLIALPLQLSGVRRLAELANKKEKGLKLDQEEEEEFFTLSQIVDIITAERVTTSYELYEPPKNVLHAIREFVKVEKGIDATAINNFLVNPPADIPRNEYRPNRIPDDVNQEYILLDNGKLLNVRTGETLNAIDKIGSVDIFERPEGRIKSIEALGNKFYKLETENSTKVYKLDGDMSLIMETRSPYEIAFSPDRRFAYLKYEDGHISSFIFDLQESRKYYFSNELLAMLLPSKHDEDDFTTKKLFYYNPHFSKDGKYLTYIERNIFSEDGDKKVLKIIRLNPPEGEGADKIKKAGEKIGEISLGQGDVEYAINPFANAVFLRNKDTGDMSLIDLETGKLVVSNAAHLRTDSTGAYTVIIGASGEMSVYSHKTKKILEAKNSDSKRIDSFTTVRLAGGETFYKLGCFNDEYIYYLDKYATFQIGTGPRIEVGRYEERYHSSGELTLANVKTGFRETYDIKTFDPLQRLDKIGAYKHPKFDLIIINNSYFDDDSLAIDPNTGARFKWPKDDALLYYYSNVSDKFPYQTLLIQRTNGQIYLMQPGKHVPLLKFLGRGYIDKMPPNFAIVAGLSEEYKLIDIEHQVYFEFEEYLTLMSQKIPVSSRQYPSVSFDGKYFVFSNSKTGDVVYLDPRNPGHPIFASPGRQEILTAIKPSDAPDRFIISTDTSGKPVIFDSKRNESSEASSEEKKIIRVNSNTFIGYNNIGDYSIYQYQEDGNILRIGLGKYVAGDRVLDYSDKLIVSETVWLANDKRQYVLDVENKKFESYKDRLGRDTKVHISASGRFSVHKQVNGDLIYYDHNEAEPTAKIIARGESGSHATFERAEYAEYLVSKDADVVIVADKHKEPPFKIYSLTLGRFISREAFQIEINSSGKFAILRRFKGELVCVNLSTGEEINSVGVDIIRIASDEQYLYVMHGYPFVRDDDSQVKYFKLFQHEKSGEKIIEHRMVSPQAGNLLALNTTLKGLPRFWEEYNNKGKKIWDRQADSEPASLPGEFGVVTRYPFKMFSPPQKEVSTLMLLLPDEDVSLLGQTKVVLWDKNKDGRVTIIDLKSGTSKIFYHFKSITQVKKELGLLKGGEVWYRMRALDNWIQYGAYSGYGLVNQDKTAILVQSDKLFYIIYANGDIKDIISFIPPGFILTDVNGNYFVFSNPETGEVIYLDPQKISSTGDTIKTEVTVEEKEKREKALELWGGAILSKRSEFIAQAQEAYQPLLKLIPEECRGQTERVLEEKIKELYNKQEAAIIRRYKTALLEGKPLAWDASLPFNHFKGRKDKITNGLIEYLQSAGDYVAQEEYAIRNKFYVSLFAGLFDLCAKSGTDISDLNVDGAMFEVLALGWNIGGKEQIEAVALVAQFIENLKESVNGQIKYSEMMSLVDFLNHAASKNISTVKKQIKKILDKREEVRNLFLKRLHQSFKKTGLDKILAYLDNPVSPESIGESWPFVVFITNEGEELKEKTRYIPKGEEIGLPSGGIKISQLINLEMKRKKKGEEDIVMDMDYLLGHINDLPGGSDILESEILNNATVQKESGGYTAEIAQNTKDAVKGKIGELIVDFYIEKDSLEKRLNYVEEATDNGFGALMEVALLIPKSTKAEGGQIELTGFFGTGKYTIFEGVDMVEIITKNQARAFMFTFNVEKDEKGSLLSIRLTGIKKVNDENLKQGVTVRRIKRINNTIPGLDALLAQRSWKIFTVFSQDEDFKIYFIDSEGQRQPLTVEKEILSEIDFKTKRRGEDNYTDFGKLRIISAKGMPLQIIDKTGLRVREIAEEYKELIPYSLRKHIQELGIVMQIPLPLIRNRSSFEHKNDYMPMIKKYIAIAFYQALVYKALTQINPQFTFENFPVDWETNDHYWSDIGLRDKSVTDLAQKINQAEYDDIAEHELKMLITESGVLDTEKKFLKLMLLVKVLTDRNNPKSWISLFLRRLAVQKEINPDMAEKERKLLSNAAYAAGDIPSIKEVPFYKGKISQAKDVATAHAQMADVERYIIPESEYSDKDKELVEQTFSIARHVGIEKIVLVSGCDFAGSFKEYKGEKAMFINHSIVFGGTEKTVDTIIHELAHFLETAIGDNLYNLFKRGFISHLSNYSHDQIGIFASAMKYISWIALEKYDVVSSSSSVDKMYKESSSNLSVNSSSTGIAKGGIAFNSLPIQTESVASSALGALSGARAFRGNMDTEWTQIQQIFNAGIRPSIQRISEYTAAVSSSPLAQDRIDQVRVMLADILRRDEENEKLAPAEESCKQLLRALEAG